VIPEGFKYPVKEPKLYNWKRSPKVFLCPSHNVIFEIRSQEECDAVLGKEYRLVDPVTDEPLLQIPYNPEIERMSGYDRLAQVNPASNGTGRDRAEGGSK